jgi:hypothetical protein
MAIPIRSIPVLEGAAAERFIREAQRVEQNPHTIGFSENLRKFEKIRDDARQRGLFI